MGWHEIAWDGMGWHGMAWDGMGWHGMAWEGMGEHGRAWDGMGWHGMALVRLVHLVCLVRVIGIGYRNWKLKLEIRIGN